MRHRSLFLCLLLAAVLFADEKSNSNGHDDDDRLGGAVRVIGWNDPGMHCMDGKDYSIYSILPPFSLSTARSSSPPAGSSIAVPPSG
ncbi:MAG: hypothetical protein R2729_01585 [Bryobacteraceae bacterium]